MAAPTEPLKLHSGFGDALPRVLIIAGLNFISKRQRLFESALHRHLPAWKSPQRALLCRAVLGRVGVCHDSPVCRWADELFRSMGRQACLQKQHARFINSGE